MGSVYSFLSVLGVEVESEADVVADFFSVDDSVFLDSAVFDSAGLDSVDLDSAALLSA
jgi:hypothetical protein